LLYNILMKNLQEIEQKISENKDKIFKDFEVEEIGVFGSYVRGEATEDSDIDILISLKKNHRVGMLKFMSLNYFLEDLLNIKVDLVLKDGIKRALKPYILNEVKYL